MELIVSGVLLQRTETADRIMFLSSFLDFNRLMFDFIVRASFSMSTQTEILISVVWFSCHRGCILDSAPPKTIADSLTK